MSKRSEYLAPSPKKHINDKQAEQKDAQGNQSLEKRR